MNPQTILHFAIAFLIVNGIGTLSLTALILVLVRELRKSREAK